MEEKAKQEAEEATFEELSIKKHNRRMKIIMFSYAVIIIILIIGILKAYTPGMFDYILKGRFSPAESTGNFTADSEIAGAHEILTDANKRNVLMSINDWPNDYFYLDDSFISLISSITFLDTIADIISESGYQLLEYI